MDKWDFAALLLMILGCVHQSHENCTTANIVERTECYFYDGDYNNHRINYGYVPTHLYNTSESACWNVSTQTKAICKKQTSIPRIDRNCVILEILDSNISTIKLNSFRNIPDLFTINITNSGVSKIEPGAFNGVNNLKNLSLSNNDITTITKGIFNQLIYLNELNVSMNTINHVEEGSFLGPDLIEIYVNNNEIEDVSPFVEDCQKLKVFDVSHNKLSRLEYIGNCTELIELYASNNRIKELPTDSFNQSPLQILDLSSNILVDIDIDAFSGLHDLKILDLSGNKINNGQQNVGIFQHLQGLRELNLSSNAITNLQLGIFTKLSSLEILDISDNQLTSFSEDIFHDLEGLKNLYINNNLLTTFGGPPVLEKLNIDSNPLNCQELSRIVKLYKTAIVRGKNHNATNIFGIGCIPNITNNARVPNVENTHENDKIGYANLLSEFLEGVKESKLDLLTQNKNISNAVQELLDEFQNSNRKNQQYLDQNQENFNVIVKQNTKYENSNDALKDFFEDVLKKLSQNNDTTQIDKNESIRPYLDNIQEDLNAIINQNVNANQFSEKILRQFEKLLNIFNNTPPEKEIIRPYLDLIATMNQSRQQELIKSEKLGGNKVMPPATENSNIFVGVLVVQIVFLIAFCLTVFYFMHSIKIRNQSRQIDEVQL